MTNSLLSVRKTDTSMFSIFYTLLSTVKKLFVEGYKQFLNEWNFVKKYYIKSVYIMSLLRNATMK